MDGFLHKENIYRLHGALDFIVVIGLDLVEWFKLFKMLA